MIPITEKYQLHFDCFYRLQASIKIKFRDILVQYITDIYNLLFSLFKASSKRFDAFVKIAIYYTLLSKWYLPILFSIFDLPFLSSHIHKNKKHRLIIIGF